jgi:class 3 adenylate cyclase
MGLHTGEADERGGDYFGPEVNRAARLMAIAHGGQIVCSPATADLVGGHLPAGVSLVDLGVHRIPACARRSEVGTGISVSIRRLPRRGLRSSTPEVSLGERRWLGIGLPKAPTERPDLLPRGPMASRYM